MIKGFSLFAALMVMTSFAVNTNISGNDGHSNTPHDVKKIALSFDDIPRHKGAFLTRTERREKLINGLQEGEVDQAVFFLNPARIDKDEFKEIHLANIDAYVDAGHVLANHTADHVRLSDMSAEEFLTDIDAAEKWLKPKAAYRPWMRHPYLDEGKGDKAKRDKVRAGLKQRALLNGYVTVDSSDWLIDSLAHDAVRAGKALDMKALGNLFVESHVQSANFAHGLAMKTLERAPVQMMLLHEADVTALYILDLAKALKANGWEIVSADEAYADPLIEIQAQNAYAAGTLLEMLASDKGIAAPRWYERNTPKIMKKLFNERVLHEESKE